MNNNSDHLSQSCLSSCSPSSSSWNKISSARTSFSDLSVKSQHTPSDLKRAGVSSCLANIHNRFLLLGRSRSNSFVEQSQEEEAIRRISSQQFTSSSQNTLAMRKNSGSNTSGNSNQCIETARENRNDWRSISPSVVNMENSTNNGSPIASTYSATAAAVAQRHLQHVASVAYNKALKDAAHLQFLTAQAASYWGGPTSRNAQVPIIIQNNTKATAEAQCAQENENQHTDAAEHSKKISLIERCFDLAICFWQSRLNRLLVLGIAGASIYFFWEWRQYKRRMQLIQRRIDANPILKFSQLLAMTADRKARTNSHYYY